MKKTDKIIWGLAAGAIALGVGWLIYTSAFWKWVPSGQVAIVYRANQGIDRSGVLKPGLHVRGPLDELIMAPTNVVAANYTNDADFATDVRAADSIEVTTRQGLIQFDVLVLYRVLDEDVWKVFDNFARKPIEEIQAGRVRREIKNVANDVASQFYLEELIGDKRDDANRQFTSDLRGALKPLGFTVERAYFVTAYPSEQLGSQFLNIEVADILRQIAALDAQAAERQKTIALITANAQNRASALIAAQTTQKSLELQELEVELTEAKKWDGSKIKVDTTGLTSVLIDPKALGAVK
jgi:hypothetical protein